MYKRIIDSFIIPIIIKSIIHLRFFVFMFMLMMPMMIFMVFRLL